MSQPLSPIQPAERGQASASVLESVRRGYSVQDIAIHGNSDPLVPHNQGERLYMALNKACRDAIFISLPKASHGPWAGFLTDDAVREGATRRSTTASGCVVANPAPFTPTWRSVIAFLDEHLRPQ